MSKNVLTALILIGLTVLILLFNAKSSISLDLLVTSIRQKAALIYLGFTVMGVWIGLLLR